MSKNKLVYLVDDDVASGKWLALQIHHYGYDVRGFPTLRGAKDAIKKMQPDVVVIDMCFADEACAGAEFIAWMRETVQEDIPVIFMSGQDGIESRLEAVRAGGKAYFTKPVDVGELVDWIDTLTAPRQQSIYHILIVDDDVSTAMFHSKALNDAGMLTKQENDPMRVMETIRDFSPELILMDMYMPDCTGQELASVIRQQPAYVGIPIVFLSSETSIKVQMAAMSEGGDDFLIKPIEPQHLVASVSARAERYRTLRSRMARDSLTGLLNHGKILEQLDFEQARAIRNRSALSFAMIDLDHFKSVNDKFGHPVGDRVLKSLSRLLKERLRKTDIVGRYGGEEFAVIMPDTTGADAVGVLDNVRKIFSQVIQHAGADDFSCTFSCGVAEYDTNGPPTQNIGKTADDTLYLAKQKGRNCVELSTR
jgi:diguanylate cyclase (GGDEF)-like protein